MTPVRPSVRLVPVLLGLLLGAGSAGADPRDDAAQAEADGRWTEAVALWDTARGDGTRASLVGFLRVLRAVGDFERLEREAARAVEQDPGFLEGALLLAQALDARGRPEAGLARLETWASRSLPADALRAQLLTRLGRRDEAGAIWSELLKGHDPDRAYAAADRLALGRAAAARGDFHGAESQIETATLDSTDYLEARIALALLFQEKHQSEIAGNELVLAAQLFPEHPDVHLAAARLAFDNAQLPRAESAARAVLEVRPQDGAARGILARLALIAERPDEARGHLDGLLARNAKDLETRALLAGAAYLAGDSSDYRAEMRRVAEQDPLYVDGFMDLGRILELSRRNDEAFAMYREVLARVPEHPEALLATGLLAMREGNETEARGFLERGFEGDPFNVRAFNQLQLLDTLAAFERYDAPHFELRLDAASDSILVPLMTERLESLYADLVRLHGWEPRRRTVVEIFPSHDWFSARVTGLPWIGGIPAVCFGDVVAMDSPRTLQGSSNWEQILRHEFGHVLALDMTDKKVPFWFTEGLSVFLEEFPRGQDWDENLVAAYTDGELVGVDSLTIAFTRPRHFGQRLLAYHESYLIVNDIVERHGWESVPKLLAAFRAGKGLEGGVREALGTSMDAFRRQALDVVAAEAAGLSVWPAPEPKRLARLWADWDTSGEDLVYLELLALTALQIGDTEKADQAVSRLLARDAENVRGVGISGLLDRAADRPDALDKLRRAAASGSRDVPVLTALAEMAVAAGDTAGALAAYGRALDAYPHGEDARLARARLLARHGDRDAARVEYEALLAHSAKAWMAAMELARLDLEGGRGEEALRRLDYALATVPLEADVEALRGQAYLLLGEEDRAFGLFQRARSLDLRSVEAMVGMARYYLVREDPEEAIYFARLALKYDPEHAGARDVLRRAEGEP